MPRSRTGYPTKAFSITKSAGRAFAPSTRPRASNASRMSFNIAIDPQIMARSVSGLSVASAAASMRAAGISLAG